MDKIRRHFKDVVEGLSGSYYRFDKDLRGSSTRFAALLLTKNNVKVRVRADLNTFSDPQNWTKEKGYKGWFFLGSGEEREFIIARAILLFM